MKNFSITTACISLLSLYGYESLAAESSNRNNDSFLIKMIADNDNHELDSQIRDNELATQKKEARDLYNNIKNDSKKEAKTLYGIAKNSSAKAYDNMKNKSSEMYDNVKNKSSEMYDNVKNKSSEMYDNVKNKSSEMYDNVKNKSSEMYDNVKNKSSKTVDYAKKEINEKRYKFQVGNLLNQKAEHDSDLRRLMNKPSLTFNGNTVSQGWYKTEKDSLNNDVSDKGGNFDAALRFKIEHSNRDLSITYGANLQTQLSFVDNYLDANKKEATLFLRNPYGELKLGYDNGIDAKMRIDGTTLQAGNAVLPVNLVGKISSNSDTPQHKQFYTSPVLWSESIADLSNIYLHDTNDHDPVIKMAKDFKFTHKKKIVNDSLPMRLTFTTSNFLGAKLGVSYSMNGYDKKIFTDVDLVEVTTASETYNKKKDEINDSSTNIAKAKNDLDKAENDYKNNIQDAQAKQAYEDAKRNFDTENVKYQNELQERYNKLTHALKGNLNAPTYRNVINGALVFDYDYYDDIKAKISITGEYAKADNDSSSLNQYASYYQGHNILAGAIGANVDYMGIKFGASYGYLGQSGLTKSLHKFDLQSAKGGGGTPGFDPYTLLGNRGDDDASIPGATGQPSANNTQPQQQPASPQSTPAANTQPQQQPASPQSTPATNTQLQQQPASPQSTPAAQTSVGSPKAVKPNNAALQTSTKSLGAQPTTTFADDDSKKTYYMTAAIGYQYQKAYFSLNYMQSSFQNNKYRNIGGGAEYSLKYQDTNKGSYKLFINYNRFSTEQNNVNDAINNKGYVVSGGLKFEF